MKRLALYFVGLVCILCNCTAQTVSSSVKDNSQQNQNKQLQQNVKGQESTPTYSIISVENTYKLRWTGKAFTGLHKDKANTWLIKAVVKGLDAKWLKHPFSITTKDVWLLKDSLQKDGSSNRCLGVCRGEMEFSCHQQGVFHDRRMRGSLVCCSIFYKRQSLYYLSYIFISNQRR